MPKLVSPEGKVITANADQVEAMCKRGFVTEKEFAAASKIAAGEEGKVADQKPTAPKPTAPKPTAPKPQQ